MTDFNQRLCGWYTGELGGEAFFDAMAADASNNTEASKWRVLAQLEQRMGERLATALTARAVELPEPGERSTSLLEQAAAMASKEWLHIMADLEAPIANFVARIREEAAQAPDDGRGIAAEYLAHEEALLAFIASELAGEGTRSTAAADALLEAWR
jgi:hypothetical protein